MHTEESITEENITEESIVKKILNHERINIFEAKQIYNKLSLVELGELAKYVREHKTDKRIASYIVDRNINYTNVCVTDCSFCSFYRKVGSDEGYVLPFEVIGKKIEETKNLGGTGILMQGGLNPTLRLGYYKELLRYIKNYKIHIHGFSPPEIVYISRLEKLSIREVISELMESGLDSIPGGGAEILVDKIREVVSKKKCSSREWLNVMEEAHNLKLYTTATMMFGHVETLDDILEHFDKIRSLQDKTNGFTAFIPWTYQEAKDSNLKSNKSNATTYLKVLALSRLYLDNIQNIQGSWVTQGPEVGQISLHFGANDLGSIMIEENVVSASGTIFKMDEERLRQLIVDAGYSPYKRDSIYKNMPKEPKEPKEKVEL